jgi:hypothetical protein
MDLSLNLVPEAFDRKQELERLIKEIENKIKETGDKKLEAKLIWLKKGLK